jgi:hypothetical protein
LSVLTFKRARIPRETIHCVKRILRQAELGKITGLAFVGFVPGGFIADACGDAHHHPDKAREMLVYLDARLRRKLAKACGNE